MTMEPSGGITVVEPGSSDDPFSVNHKGGQQQTVVDPRATAIDNPPASQPADTAPKSATSEPAAKPLTQADVDAIVASRLREAQSGMDKRAAQLQADLKAERDARAASEAKHRDEMRQIQLEGLRPDQRQAVQQQWQLEDREAAIKAKESAVTDYYAAVERQRVFQAYGIYGVTEAELAAITDPAEMEPFAAKKSVDFFRSGGQVQEAGKGDKTEKPAAPAGANAHYDAGGSPPAPQTGQLLAGFGVDQMGANIKNMFATEGNNW